MFHVLIHITVGFQFSTDVSPLQIRQWKPTITGTMYVANVFTKSIPITIYNFSVANICPPSLLNTLHAYLASPFITVVELRLSVLYKHYLNQTIPSNKIV